MTSHEMRNPLSAILHSAEEILTILEPAKNEVNEVSLENINNIVESARTINLCVGHQTRLSNDILTLSRLDSNLLQISPVPVQPDVFVQQTLKVFEAEVKSSGMTLSLHIEPTLTMFNVEWLLFDSSRVLQILVSRRILLSANKVTAYTGQINLITNAIKFSKTEEKKAISVSVGASLKKPSSEKGEITYFPTRIDRKQIDNLPPGEVVYLSFAVRDTGRGLSEAEKNGLFERFQQANARTHVEVCDGLLDSAGTALLTLRSTEAVASVSSSPANCRSFQHPNYQYLRSLTSATHYPVPRCKAVRSA